MERKGNKLPPIPDPLSGLAQLEEHFDFLDSMAEKIDEVGSASSFSEVREKLFEFEVPEKQRSATGEQKPVKEEKSYLDYLTEAKRNLERASRSEIECPLCREVIEEDHKKISQDEETIKRAVVGMRVMDEMNINKPWEQLDEKLKLK